MVWNIYILKCGDGSLYTGITNNIKKRLIAHTSGHGAKYTKGRGPLEHVYSETAIDRSAAQKRESSIKKLSRAEKLRLIAASPLLSRT
ncbi:MAG: GIY-YIG nuclease family protein [Proteobacteria bacterium]|nr:GIY-YIG nuclease family protein [Pseudomonadota bacterium]